MITKENYGNIENVTIAQFGHGTMRVTNGTAKDKSYKAIFLGDQEQPEEIGSYCPPAKDSDEFNPKIVITFENKHSFDVFYDYVQNIKREFENEEL